MAKRNGVSKLVRTSDAPSGPSPETERRWRAENALRTITEAANIQKDKALMREVKKVAREQVKQLQCVAKPSGRR